MLDNDEKMLVVDKPTEKKKQSRNKIVLNPEMRLPPRTGTVVTDEEWKFLKVGTTSSIISVQPMGQPTKSSRLSIRRGILC